MTRIVAGRHGGRPLRVPPGQGTRPTSDRVREALFNTLATVMDLSGARVLDLYAGSGAVGLEALSRGAARVLLVEADPRAARVARDNIALLRASGSARLVTARVDRVLAVPPDEPYDLVFADPPYTQPEEEVVGLLTELVRSRWLAPDAVVVVERSSRSPEPAWVPGITGVRGRRYGETVLWYGRRS